MTNPKEQILETVRLLKEARAKAAKGKWFISENNEICYGSKTDGSERFTCDEYYDDEFVVLAANKMDKLCYALETLVNGLRCNETFHRLGGIDDCEPCKTLSKAAQILAKGKE